MADYLPQRRRYPRIPSKNAVLVRKLGPEAVEDLGKTRTVGLGGCGLTSEESFGVGSLVEVLISIERRVVKAQAEVAYEKEAFGCFDIGLKFRHLHEDDAAALRQLLQPPTTPDG